MRETESDLRNEAAILGRFCQLMKCDWAKLGNGGKYRIDSVLFRDKKPVAWVEVKDYKAGLFLGLNVPKYIEGCELSNYTNLPFFLLFRHDGRIGYLKIHNGAWPNAEARLLMAGGTPKGRQPLPDDVEPIFLFDEKEVEWCLSAN